MVIGLWRSIHWRNRGSRNFKSRRTPRTGGDDLFADNVEEGENMYGIILIVKVSEDQKGTLLVLFCACPPVGADWAKVDMVNDIQVVADDMDCNGPKGGPVLIIAHPEHGLLNFFETRLLCKSMQACKSNNMLIYIYTHVNIYQLVLKLFQRMPQVTWVTKWFIH